MDGEQHTSQGENGQPLVFRQSRPLRIMGVGSLTAMLIMTGAALLWAWMTGGPNRVQLESAAILTVVVILGLLVGLSFRCRIDDSGITVGTMLRRRFVPWDVFASGLVRREGGYFTFRLPGMGKSARRVSFGLLSRADAERALAACLAHWTTPPPTQAPATVSFRASPFLLAGVRGEGEGLRVRYLTKTKMYGWADVQGLKVCRMSGQHCDFVEMRLRLPDREFSIWNGTKAGQSLQDMDAPAVLAFMCHHVPPERVAFHTLDGPASGHEELNVREAWWRNYWRKGRRVTQVVMVIAAFICAGSVYRSFEAGDTFLALSNLTAVVVMLAYAMTSRLWKWFRLFDEGPVLQAIAQERDRLLQAGPP